MGLREDIVRKIERKQQELAEREIAFNIERAAAASYIQALQDMLKSLPRDASDARPAQQVLRPGSAMAEARDALKMAGKPLHINDLLKAMGRPTTKENRTSIGGSMANYVRRGEIFIRTAPNTFGLVGMEQATALEPPPGFGSVRAKKADLLTSVPSAEEEEVDEAADPSDDDDEVPF